MKSYTILDFVIPPLAEEYLFLVLMSKIQLDCHKMNLSGIHTKSTSPPQEDFLRGAASQGASTR
jgi:hypothetical protein